MPLLLKLISNKLILRAAWSLIDPVLLRKVEKSDSKIDDKIYIEIKVLIMKLINEA